MPLHSSIDQLLALIDQAYDRRSWHGPNLRGSLRGVRADVASWRPSPDRHSIQELTAHCAYWKYTVRRRLTGDKRGAFELDGSNWFDRAGTTDEKSWRADLALLGRAHVALRETIAALSLRALKLRRRGFDNAAMITGIAAHDLYHAGQIQLLKRLHSDSL